VLRAVSVACGAQNNDIDMHATNAGAVQDPRKNKAATSARNNNSMRRLLQPRSLGEKIEANILIDRHGYAHDRKSAEAAGLFATRTAPRQPWPPESVPVSPSQKALHAAGHEVFLVRMPEAAFSERAL
jgi:hypothetical protein